MHLKSVITPTDLASPIQEAKKQTRIRHTEDFQPGVNFTNPLQMRQGTEFGGKDAIQYHQQNCTQIY